MRARHVLEVGQYRGGLTKIKDAADKQRILARDGKGVI
jgi:hypothetical protein